jgi:branched-chain amino acid transport system substrate-binding protein
MRRVAIIGCVAVMASAGCGGGDEGSAARRSMPPPATLETCSRVFYEGEGRPEVLIVTDMPLQGAYANDGLQGTNAVRLVLEERGFRAGEHTVGYVSCDGSTPNDDISPAKCRRSARSYVSVPAVVAVIGPFFSSCMFHQLPVTNRAGLAVVGPSNTYVGLTRGGPGIPSGEPERFYPARARNFVRLAAPDDLQGRAHAALARGRGVERAFVAHDGVDAYGLGTAAGFRDAAEREGIEIVGFETWDPEAARYPELVRAVERSGADAVFLGGYIVSNADSLIKGLRARMGDELEILGTEGMFPVTVLVDRAGSAAEGMLITLSSIANDELTGPGADFLERFRERTSQDPCCYTVHVAQATHVLLDAIAASDGSRKAVTAALRRVRVQDGLIGAFGFDKNGDVTPGLVSMYRITGGEQELFDVVNTP